MDSADDFLKMATRGETFLKFGAKGAPHKRHVRYSPTHRSLDWGTNSIRIRDIYEVHTTVLSTERLQRKANQKALVPGLVFSVVTEDRTLDLQAESTARRDVWVAGLRALIEARRTPAPSPAPSTRVVGTGFSGAEEGGEQEPTEEELRNALLPREQRNLALFTPEERERLAEMKAELAATTPELLEHERADDFTLVQFLRARELDVAKALHMWTRMTEWRAANNVDGILDRHDPYAGHFPMACPHAFHGHDNEDRPIYIEKTGKFMVDELDE